VVAVRGILLFVEDGLSEKREREVLVYLGTEERVYGIYTFECHLHPHGRRYEIGGKRRD
jgi:hypothetical protein